MEDAVQRESLDRIELEKDSDPASYSAILLITRFASVVLSVVTSIILAKLLGPTLLGKFGLLQSVAGWIVLLGSLGSNQILLRYLPGIRLKEGERGCRKLFASLLGLRLTSGVILALAYMLGFVTWGDSYQTSTVVWMGLAIVVTTSSTLVFSGLLANHKISQWSFRPLVRSVSRILFLPTGFLVAGLPGVGAGSFLIAISVLGSGVFWLRKQLPKPSFHWRILIPYLKFASSLFTAGLMQSAIFASGVLIVKLVTNDFREVGYFGIGMIVFGHCSFILPRLAVTYIPMAAKLRSEGREPEIRNAILRAIGLSSLAAVFIVYCLLLPVYHGLPILLSADYAPAMVNLFPLSGALVIFVFFSLCRALAVASDHTRLLNLAGALQLLAFWTLGIWMTGKWGSLGTSIALSLALILGAACLWLGIYRTSGIPVGKWIKITLLGSAFLPAIRLADGFGSSLIVLAVVSSLFFSLTIFFRLVKPEEIRLAASRLTDSFKRLLGK